MDMLSFSMPTANPETQRFWDACNEGKLLLGACRSCGKHHYYPRPFCPHCGTDDVEWVESAGIGEIHTFTVMRRMAPVRVLCMVWLKEGVRMLSVLRTDNPEDVRIGQEVRLAFADSEEAGGLRQKMSIFERTQQ